MYDGCRLATDVHLPTKLGRARLPTILSRTAYGRAGPVACLHAIARELTARGFATVAQDIRGRFESEGVAEPFGGETADASATLDWIVAQPWSDGEVVMIGDSYGGWLQWAAAASRHGALRAIVPGMSTARVPDVWMYDGGVFNLSMMAQWAITGWSGRENVFEMPDWSVRPLIELLDRWFPDRGRNPYVRWATHGPSRAYWRSGAFADVGATKVRVPALHLGGWWDLFRTGQLSDYVAAATNSDRQYLLMLASDHHHLQLKPRVWTSRQWEDDTAFAERYVQLVEPYLHALFSTDGSDTPARATMMVAHSEPNISTSWPPADMKTLSLYPVDGGSALCGTSGGGLARRPAGRETVIRWAHDPKDPVPSREEDPFGLLIEPADEQTVQGRDDVLTFTTQELRSDLCVLGAATLLVSLIRAEGHSLIVKLSDVDIDGRCFAITEGAVWLDDPGRAQMVPLRLHECAYNLRAGHCLRLEIAASHYPRYAPPSARDPFHDTGSSLLRYEISVGGWAGSRLVLPVRDDLSGPTKSLL